MSDTMDDKIDVFKFIGLKLSMYVNTPWYLLDQQSLKCYFRGMFLLVYLYWSWYKSYLDQFQILKIKRMLIHMFDA